MLRTLGLAMVTLSSIVLSSDPGEAAPRGCATIASPEAIALTRAMMEDGRWDQARRFLDPQRGEDPPAAFFAITVHVVRFSNGSGGIPLEWVETAIDNLNGHVASTGLTFFQEGPTLYLDDDTFATFEQSEFCDLVSQNRVPDTMNVYFVPESPELCGLASFSGGSCQGVIMNNSCSNPATNDSTFSHEVGHYLNLYHTHETAFGSECVSGSNCGTTGDLICDTPADPLLTNQVDNSCQYTGDAPDACGSGAPYTPDERNLMSYSRKLCRDYFSAEQLSIFSFTAYNQRASHLRPTGICCFQGNCLSILESSCDNGGGQWIVGGTCDTFECASLGPSGACCLDNGDCLDDRTSLQCENLAGIWRGEGTACGFLECNTNQGLVEFHNVIAGANLVTSDTETWTVDIYAAVEEGSRIDAVAGNSLQQKSLSSSAGFYQNPFGGPTSQEINPAFFESVPDLRWDSRVTIGALDQSGAPFGTNTLGNLGIDWDLFEAGGSLSVGNGTWYILPTDSQGVAQPFVARDCEERFGVLIARLTARELDSSVSIEALIQGQNAAGVTFQETLSETFTYQPTADCNTNGVPDDCDLALGTSIDSNENGIPDECENSCPGDADGDGDSDVNDILAVIADFGTEGPADVTGDGIVDVSDVLQVLAFFGGC